LLAAKQDLKRLKIDEQDDGSSVRGLAHSVNSRGNSPAAGYARLEATEASAEVGGVGGVGGQHRGSSASSEPLLEVICGGGRSSGSRRSKGSEGTLACS
jgi:hypothetical protein